MKGISQFYVHISLIVVKNIQSCTGTQVRNVFPSGLAWEAFQKVTLIVPEVASEASKVLMVRSWTSVRDAIKSTPGASPPHLGGRTGRDKYGACIGEGQTKSEQERKALVLSLSTPPSRAGRKMVLVAFFMY